MPSHPENVLSFSANPHTVNGLRTSKFGIIRGQTSKKKLDRNRNFPVNTVFSTTDLKKNGFLKALARKHKLQEKMCFL